MVAATVLIGLCGGAIAVFGEAIASLYLPGRRPEDLKVIALAALYLKVAAAFQVVDALQVVGAMCLRGLKDARAPMLMAGASYWLVGAPTCLLLAFGLHLGGLGVWLGLASGLAVAALSMVLRFWILSQPPRVGPVGP
jgi:MATE family multidrug resistance protein